MSKYDADEPSFLQKAARATPDSLLRDIANDSRRTNPTNPWPRAEAGPVAKAEPVPTYVEWAAKRGWFGVSLEKARALYLTRKTAGEDVGPVIECPVWRDGGWVDTYGSSGSSVSPVPHNGWVDPGKIADWRPPGERVMNQLMDQQDAIDRRDRERLLGKVR